MASKNAGKKMYEVRESVETYHKIMTIDNVERKVIHVERKVEVNIGGNWIKDEENSDTMILSDYIRANTASIIDAENGTVRIGSLEFELTD